MGSTIMTFQYYLEMRVVDFILDNQLHQIVTSYGWQCKL